MLFSGSSEGGHTLVVDLSECTEIAFGQIFLPGRERKLFQSNCLTTGFSTRGGKKGRITEDEMG